MNRARLVRSGVTDFLTGWHNRRYFHNRLREELARAERTGKALACLMIDVDHFKEINDRFGHLAGDEALKEVARRAEAEIRAGDTGARFGGDEFAILLAGAEIAHALKLAERIHHGVGATPIRVHGGAHVTVTLSIGLATARPQPRSHDYKALAERLIAEADAALYRAKSAGRNRVESPRTSSAELVASAGLMRARLRMRRSSTRNIGTPSNAMMAPTGSWRGAADVRATRSAAANKVPPASAAAGTTTRCAAVPNASRTRCGITRPMKPMVPPWMTAPAVSSPAASR